MSFRSVLKVSDLTLSVHIGCTAEERSNTQEVRVSFQIQLGQLPGACLSDRLSETICYETLIKSIHALASPPIEFNTVEKLAYRFFEKLKEQLPQGAKLSLIAQKVNPPIELLQGGVYFELADEGFRL